jgi:uncharacterized protein (DUF362 family)
MLVRRRLSLRRVRRTHRREEYHSHHFAMSSLDVRTVVAYASGPQTYPRHAPFDPSTRYPEYAFDAISPEPNGVYDAVRECFRLSGLDAERFGTREWNPLRGLINPGETVLLKPNLVVETHPRDPEGWRYVLTQGSVVRAVADYIALALGGRGRLILADAPVTDASFSTMTRLLGLDAIQAFYAACGLPLELIDLRLEEWRSVGAVPMERRNLPGDPRGGVAFNLGAASELTSHHGAGRYYGADYDVGEVNHHHSGGRHEYLIAASAIQCDVLFSLPKLKTHKKAGITVSLKNLVGVNADKNWLPHHTEGDPSNGGDEHPRPDLLHRVERKLVPIFQQIARRVPVIGPRVHRAARATGAHIFGDTEEVIRSGNWWGNETTWRMCLDLNKLLLYGNPDGTMRPPGPEGRKRHFVMVDGIIAGEGRGPTNPDPVHAGLLVFGLHPASVDAACAYLMGFDPGRIPIVRQAFRCHHYPLTEWDWTDVQLISDRAEWNDRLPDIPDDATFHFQPHYGWAGHIERRAQLVTAG